MVNEQAELELARRGLLSLTMDASMMQPVMRGQNQRMQCVKANMQSTEGFHFAGIDAELSGYSNV